MESLVDIKVRIRKAGGEAIIRVQLWLLEVRSNLELLWVKNHPCGKSELSDINTDTPCAFTRHISSSNPGHSWQPMGAVSLFTTGN